MRYLLTLLIFLFTTFAAKACDCGDSTTIKDEIRNAATIFSGKVISITPYKILKPGVQDSNVLYRLVAVKFRIDKQWKGKPTKEITILTGIIGWQGDDCAYIFKKKRRYLVFAFSEDRGVFGETSDYLFSNNDLFTDCCSHTCLLPEAKRLGYLNQLQKNEPHSN